MNTQTIGSTSIAAQIEDEADNRVMQLQTGQHALATGVALTLVSIDTIFDVPAPINSLAWALRSAANNALWNCFTAFQNKDRKPATLNTLEDMPDFIRAMLETGSGDGDRPADDDNAPLGSAPAIVRSSWMAWAETYKMLVAECLKVANSCGIPLGDRLDDAGKIQRGMVSYIRTPMQEAEFRAKPKAGTQLDETEARVLIPARFKDAVKEGTQTQQQRLQKLDKERNTEAAIEIAQYLGRCDKKIALQPHEAYSFLARFKDDFERSVSNDITKPRLMNIDGTLKEEALGEMALADGLAKQVELEMASLVHDHGDTIIIH